MPNGIIIEYEVQYWPTAQPQNITTVNTSAGVTNYTVSGLSRGTEVQFSVRAYTAVGPGNMSSVSETSLTKPRE